MNDFETDSILDKPSYLRRPHPEKSPADKIHPELTHTILEAAKTVLAVLKPGLNEKAYENALAIELRKRGHAVEQHRTFDVIYDGVVVDTLVPDLLVDGLVIVAPVLVEEFNEDHHAKMLGQLTITKIQLAILLNFSHADLRSKRVHH